MYKKFKEIIDKKGVTLYRVAKDTQIATSTFYDWKHGRYTPKIDKLKKIAEYLCVNVNDLLE